MLNERLDNTGASKRIWSHHEHLILLHSVEERSHVWSDCLHIQTQLDY